MKPIAITLGDPAGIGPEIVVAALAAWAKERPLVPVEIFGDAFVLKATAERLGLPLCGQLHVVSQLDASCWSPGVSNLFTAQAQVDYLEAAVKATQTGQFRALVTAPIDKTACKSVGFAFPGHTEFLAERLLPPDAATPAGDRVTMLFQGPTLTVSLVTVHEAQAQVARALTAERLKKTVRQTVNYLRGPRQRFHPRVAIAALNPHAGEQGHLGREEIELIQPTLLALREEISDATLIGPAVPDVVFRQHRDGVFDAVVAMYHDQALIPVKLIDFDQAVNVTLGLPLVRTSPDHGVARDIAGRGVARWDSFLAALRLAANLSGAASTD